MIEILESVKSNLHEAEGPLLSANQLTSQAAVDDLKRGIDAPTVLVSSAPLGGTEIYLTISLQSREEWTNGILQNSPYFQLRLSPDGVLETVNPFSRTLKFRKTHVKSVEQAVDAINAYIGTIKNSMMANTPKA